MDFEKIIQDQNNKIQALEAQLNTTLQRCDQYAQAYDSLQRQLKDMLRHRFGKRSERYIDPEHPQLSLFDDNKLLFATADTTEAVVENDIKVTEHTRKKKKKSEKELPRRIEVIPVPDADKQCVCGACKTFVRYETKELLNYEPPVFEIIEQRREVLACPRDCEGAMVTAPAPLQVLPKTKVTPAFLAFLIVSKLEDRQPLYHLEKQLFERYAVDCSRQTMARWLIDLVPALQPIYNLCKDEVIEYDVASCDATTLQVLNEPGRKAETKSYVYCIRGGPPERAIVLYDYNDREHKAFVKKWFEGFTGYLHVDGDNFFELVGATDNVQLIHCNAHARRKFEPVAQSTKGQGIAKDALRFFKALYKIERQAKNENLTPEQRYELRQRHSKPLLDEFKAWLDKIYPTVLPQSPLGHAINYCIKLWEGLSRFTEDGRLDIDNNLTEQQIKPFVIARKNFLFASSVDGAHALCMHFSLIRTAKLHGWDPYLYYVQLLKNIPFCKSVDDYEKLLPWNLSR